MKEAFSTNTQKLICKLVSCMPIQLLELMKNIFQKIVLFHDTNHAIKTAERYKGTHCLKKKYSQLIFDYDIYYIIILKRKYTTKKNKQMNALH